MPVDFEFATATRIVFGRGTSQRVPSLVAEMGRKAFVVVGNDTTRADFLIEGLRKEGVETRTFSVGGEPTTDMALDGVEGVRDAASDVVVAIGGGSVVDTGKLIAALATNHGPLEDYLEVVGKGRKIDAPPAPYVAVPTTAGTGAEVTRNAVVLSPEHRVKVSVRSPLMLARLAVVDPDLTHSMPPEVTASTGLDALTQLLEAFVSNKANPLTDGVCREGLRRAARSLRKAYEDGSDAGAREDMAVASLFGGLALANAKLGAAHGFAGPLGGRYAAPHGVICARLLPFVTEANVRALKERAPTSAALARYDEVASILAGDPTLTAADGVAWIRDLCSALQVPPLSTVGVKEADIAEIVPRAAKSSSMKGNPIALTESELTDVLRQAL